MYLWIELAGAAQSAALPEFPVQEYAKWRGHDSLSALSPKRFAVQALHCMGFKFLKHELVNIFHIPDKTLLLQFPTAARGSDVPSCNGNWLLLGEARQITVVDKSDILVNGGPAGENAPLGVGSSAPVSRQLPDIVTRKMMWDLDGRNYNYNFCQTRQV